ncbi:MAG: hypothetical protein ACRCT1_08885 [Microcoleaceae cyanobacterium]
MGIGDWAVSLFLLPSSLFPLPSSFFLLPSSFFFLLPKLKHEQRSR